MVRLICRTQCLSSSFLVNSVDGPSTFYGKVEAEIDAVSSQRTYLAHSTMKECSWQSQCDKECPLLFATRCVYVLSALPSSSISIYSGNNDSTVPISLQSKGPNEIARV